MFLPEKELVHCTFTMEILSEWGWLELAEIEKFLGKFLLKSERELFKNANIFFYYFNSTVASCRMLAAILIIIKIKSSE